MLTPIKAIRAKCLDCSNDSFKEVEHCPIERCPLYPYRFGKNPNIKLSEEEKARRAALVSQRARRLGPFPKTATQEGKDTTHGNSTENAQPDQ